MDNTLKYNKPWILQRADPYVYRHTDGAYYFTASVPEYDRIVLRKSDTLAGLETADETEIWHKHESGPQSIHICMLCGPLSCLCQISVSSAVSSPASVSDFLSTILSYSGTDAVK